MPYNENIYYSVHKSSEEIHSLTILGFVLRGHGAHTF